MQLGYVGSNWYSVDAAFVRQQTERGLPICAPGYYFNGTDQCIKLDTGSTSSGGGNVGPISVAVNPVVNTQVSPQVSPAFQQQYQPSNSPASAGTSQVAPSSQSSPSQTGITSEDLQKALAQQNAVYREAQLQAEEQRQAEAQRMTKAINDVLTATASMPSPAMSVPVAPSDTAAPVPAVVTPPLTNAPQSDNKAALIAGAVALFAFFALKTKRK